ncbi:hypothetical protein [Paenibacillus sp. 481]|uniref:hypothetical protein n=1 Tax=Paenibacillus sp. 481 TaxID=2835869 RepID=UPI001E3E3AE5|nr:hypothetical protein [Paenibacillus sp. 481]UHA74028.1 hypothetical protein KIK04_02395 [Paenibacillus sp. 481]
MTGRTALSLTLYSFACGSLVGLYPFLPLPLNLVCSLGAFLLGIRFFKRYETRKMRFGFIALAVLYCLVSIFFMAMVIHTNKLPGVAI